MQQELLPNDDSGLRESHLSKLLTQVKTRMLIIETTGDEEAPKSNRTKASDLLLELMKDGLADEWKAQLVDLLEDWVVGRPEDFEFFSKARKLFVEQEL